MYRELRLSRNSLCAAVAGADPVETAELLDVDVDHLTGMGPFVTAYRLGWFQIAHAAQSKTLQDAADGRP